MTYRLQVIRKIRFDALSFPYFIALPFALSDTLYMHHSSTLFETYEHDCIQEMPLYPQEQIYARLTK